MITNPLHISVVSGLPLRIRVSIAFHRLVAMVSNDEQTDRATRFYAIIKHYNALIAKICLSFSLCREDFEDLRQDVFLNIWKGLRDFRDESAVSTWIYRVALNTCVTFMRKSRQRDEVSMHELVNELYDTSSPEDVERYRLMYRLIERLKPLDRSVVMMWLDGRSYEEIAAVVGVSRDSVASRLKRSRDRLVQLNNPNINF